MNDRLTRNREQSAAPVLASVGIDTTPSGDSCVVRITGTATGAGQYVAAQPLTIGGPETAGAAFTKTDFGTPIVVACIATVPPIGTQLRAESIDGRWVVAYYGS